MLAITFLPGYESVSVTFCFAWCPILPQKIASPVGGRDKKKGIHYAVSSKRVTLVLILHFFFFLVCDWDVI